MRTKVFISSFVLMVITILTFSISRVYADTTTSKPVVGTYYYLNHYYATSNFDVHLALDKFKDKLTWDGIAPLCDEEKEVYMDFGEYPADPEVIVLQPHLGVGKNVYGMMTRIHRFESYDNKAEYMIAYSDLDQIICIVDGNTYKDDLGLLVNDFFKNKVDDSDKREYNFSMPYKNAEGLTGKGSMSGYIENGNNYVAFCVYSIGFNLTNGNTTNQQENLEDPAIYGGNDEVQIDDTPTESSQSGSFNGWQIFGIVVSSLVSIVGIYLIYLLGKKIYEIMKGN